MTTVTLKRFDPWVEERKFPQKKVHLEIDANLAPRHGPNTPKAARSLGRKSQDEFSSTVSATALGVETYSGKTSEGRRLTHQQALRSNFPLLRTVRSPEECPCRAICLGW